MFNIIAPLLLALIISVIFGHIFIPILKSKKLGQKILEIGPRWHKSKEGTPIMGGLLFITGITAALLAFGIIAMYREKNYIMLYTYCMALLFGIIGFTDDYVKLFKKQNLGLTAIQKLILQFAVAIIYVVLLKINGFMNSELFIPFAKISVDIGIFYYILIVVGIVYIVNSVNITDGIDGLCGTVTSIVTIMFIIIAYVNKNETGMILTSACLGGLIGFLFFNFYPAKVFMGDTGSLFLGGIIVGFSIWFNMPILIILFGIIYIIESLSVMIQVTSFKMTGKRVFKMSPIHHHYEMSGWSELKIVAVASVITLIMSAVSLLGVL